MAGPLRRLVQLCDQVVQPRDQLRHDLSRARSEGPEDAARPSTQAQHRPLPAGSATPRSTRWNVSDDKKEATAVSSFVVYQNILDGENSHLDGGESRLFLIGKYYDKLAIWTTVRRASRSGSCGWTIGGSTRVLTGRSDRVHAGNTRVSHFPKSAVVCEGDRGDKSKVQTHMAWKRVAASETFPRIRSGSSIPAPSRSSWSTTVKAFELSPRSASTWKSRSSPRELSPTAS